ncbi:hypothetical protein IMX26_13015 [Clostridium sp. 'deep sea']|uniref:hypothetical protein n=1 Tax=Clostridium sp. 'deep sea' TaxID=2779445 RepID=UPI0018966377|nr:hypothetical protein [Clostridium sp. 'deep sea']QOR34406.1 hypothetical protein IMX26_13015 [Clostridium sp. 'deep sea']
MNKRVNLKIELLIVLITLTVVCFTILALLMFASYFDFINIKTADQNGRYNYEQFINYNSVFTDSKVNKTK